MKNKLLFTRSLGLKLTAIVFALLLYSGQSWGQILTFEFSALAGDEVSATSNSNNANLTSSTITRGAGLTASGNTQRYNATSWAITSIANAVSGNDYMQFAITPNSGYQFSVSSIVVQWQRSSTGNTAISLRSSVDNYATDLDAVKTVVDNALTQTFTWTFAQANSSSAVTYRFYSYAEAAAGTGGPGDGTGNDIVVNGTVTSTGGSAPTVTTPTASSILTTSATLGGNITADGGSTITERGTVWKSSAGVTIADNLLAEGGTSTGVFTHSRSGLPSGTQIFYTAYAINGVGTTLSTEASFYTQSTEPSSHAASFIATAASQTQIDLTFSAASTITDAAGYLILQKTGSAPTGTPTDAIGYTVGATIIDGTVAAIVTNTADIAKSITGLTAGTHYFFTLFPYNWDGATTATYNYKTDGSVPGADATTNASLDVTSKVEAPATQISLGDISSTATTSGAAVDVFKIKITDLGTADAAATKVTQVKIAKTGTAVLNTAVAGAELWGASKITTGTPVITATDITFPIISGNLDIANASSQEITLKVWLSTTVTDNSTLVFSVPQTSHGFTADAAGSTFDSDFGAAVIGNTMTIRVAATKLLFTTVPTAVASNTNFTVAIAATDANNNTDIDAAGTVTLAKNTGSGNVTSVTGLAQSLGSGVYSWSDVQNDATGGNTFDLQCTHATLTQATSGTITISAYTVGDFGFTATSGTWVTISNWKQWDGSGWNTTPSGVPAITDNLIILAGKTCTVEASAKNCKNLMVETTGKLYTANTTMSTPRYVNVSGNITCNGTIGNGAGSDDVISFNISGGITSTISGSGVFTANRLRRNSGTGILNLIIAMDIELRYNGDALYNATSAPDATQAFNVTINAGKFANLTGNTGTPTAGYALKSVDAGTIYGKLTVTGTLTNAGTTSSLVIKSNSTGTGSLITSSTPNATVERYLAKYTDVNDKMFHFISSPVAAQAIRTEFVTNTPTANQDFYSFSESTNEWINSRADGNIWNTLFEDNFAVGKGYMVAYSADVTKNFTGILNAGTQVLNCFYTAAGSKGWILVGNPFASAIDWDYIKNNAGLGNGMDDALYYYDNTAKNYRYYILLAGDTKTTLGSGQPYIPAMQGFMVHAKAGDGLTRTVTISNAARTHSGQNVFYKTSNSVPGSLSLKVSANGYEDEAFIHFNHAATTAFDGEYDAFKLKSYSANVPSIYTVASDGNLLAINGLPEVEENSKIPEYFEAGTNGQYTLTANLQNLLDAHVYLVDNKLSKTQNLSDNPVYAFTASTTDEPSRFKLTFKSVGINETVVEQPFTIYATNNTVYVANTSATSAKGEVYVYNTLGQVMANQNLSGNLTKINIATTGYYLVKVVTKSTIFTGKVFVKQQ